MKILRVHIIHIFCEDSPNTHNTYCIFAVNVDKINAHVQCLFNSSFNGVTTHELQLLVFEMLLLCWFPGPPLEGSHCVWHVVCLSEDRQRLRTMPWLLDMLPLERFNQTTFSPSPLTSFYPTLHPYFNQIQHCMQVSYSVTVIILNRWLKHLHLSLHFIIIYYCCYHL